MVSESFKDWKTWLSVAIIGLLIALSVRLSAEALSGDRERLIAMEDRVSRLEKSLHPATTKRYTTDDAARDQARISTELGRIDERLQKMEEDHRVR